MSDRHVPVQEQKFTITVPEDDWSTPVQVTDLARSGLLARVLVRFPASSTVTEATIRVYAGDYDATTDPAAVPDEDIFYEATAIAVTGSALVADYDYNVRDAVGGAPYALRRHDETMWVALEGTAGSAPDDAVVLLVATDLL